MKGLGIYQIKSLCNPDKIYIGSSINLSKRKREHLYKLNLGVHDNKKLQFHVNKYGVDDLVFYRVTECDKENLLAFEQFYIDSLNPWFNICLVAGRKTGVIASQKTRLKMSLARMGSKRSDESKKNMSEAQKGNKHNLGKKHSDQTKRKISEAQKGEKNHRYNKKPWSFGTPLAEETKSKIRESMKGKIPWNKGKIGLQIAWNKGLKKSEV